MPLPPCSLPHARTAEGVGDQVGAAMFGNDGGHLALGFPEVWIFDRDRLIEYHREETAEVSERLGMRRACCSGAKHMAGYRQIHAHDAVLVELYEILAEQARDDETQGRKQKRARSLGELDRLFVSLVDADRHVKELSGLGPLAQCSHETTLLRQDHG